MRQRLHRLFLSDRAALTKMYAVAIGISVIFGTGQLLTGTPIRDSVVTASILTFLILSIWTVVYCSTAHVRQISVSPGNVSRRLAFVGGLFAFAAALGLSTTRLEAEIVVRRLRKYATGNFIPEAEANSLTNLLVSARDNRLAVSPALVSALGPKLLPAPGSKLGWPHQPSHMSLYRAAEAAAGLQSTLHGAPRAEIPQLITLPDHSVFDRSYIHGLPLSLDTKAFLDSHVENCTVTYRGGPVVLENTAFVSCDFDFAETAQGRDLLLLLTQRNDPNFSYRADEILGNGHSR